MHIISSLPYTVIRKTYTTDLAMDYTSQKGHVLLEVTLRPGLRSVPSSTTRHSGSSDTRTGK